VEEAGEMNSTVLQLVDQPKPKCSACGSMKVGTAGKKLRATTGELVQRYRCRRCGTSFQADTYRMGKTPRAVVDLAVSMAREGMAINRIQQELPRRTGVSRSHHQIRRWLALYAPELSWRQHEPKVDAGALRLSKIPPRRPKVPSFGLDDVRGNRRILIDEELTSRVRERVRGKYSAYSRAYHSLYSNGRAVYTRGQWAPTIRFYRSLSRKLGIPAKVTEKHVAGVMAGKSGRAKAFRGPFPVSANGGFAFLIGLFYASGSTRSTFEPHFAVDREVAVYLQEELSQEVHESPTLLAQGSENKPEHGTHDATYGKIMLQVLKKFGLKLAKPVQLGRGKYVPSRYLVLGVPNWIKREPYFLHRFVEGYANGLKLSVGLEGRLDGRAERGTFYPTVYCTAKLSFCCRDAGQLEEFSRVVEKHLSDLGVGPGYLTRNRLDGRKMQHRSYSWHTMAGLRNFRDAFLVLRPMAKLKIGLRLNPDPVIKHVLQRTRDLDNYVLGSLVEGPKTEDALANLCPRRPYNITTTELLRPSIGRLAEMKVIRKNGPEWVYDPAGFVDDLADYFRRRVRAEQVQRALVKQDPMHSSLELKAHWDIAAKRQLEELAPLLEVRR
jgi:transposase-like protein